MIPVRYHAARIVQADRGRRAGGGDGARRARTGGYVRRVRDRKNLRRIHIFITPKGYALRDELLPHAFELHALGVKGISERDLKIVRATLDKIRDNMAEVLNRDQAGN